MFCHHGIATYGSEAFDSTSMENKYYRLPIDRLDEPHRVAVTRAITNLLSTEIVEITFAQIGDGLPLAEILEDAYSDLLFRRRL
jgi:hypothetical protein